MRPFLCVLNQEARKRRITERQTRCALTSEVGSQILEIRSSNALFPITNLLFVGDGASHITKCLLVGPALLVGFAQSARGAFTCAITALGEFRFQLVDFVHAPLQFRTERGDFFLAETVEGHFPDAMRHDLGRCHFVEQRLRHAKGEPFFPRRQVEAAAVGIT